MGSWDSYLYAVSALFHEVDAASGKPLLKQIVKAYTFRVLAVAARDGGAPR